MFERHAGDNEHDQAGAGDNEQGVGVGLSQK